MLRKANSSTECTEIAGSSCFSGEWYLAQYPDVAESGIDPARHYLEDGAALGYDPGPDFSTRGYLHRYPDVAKAGMNPLLHYLRHGKSEGRVIVPSQGEEEIGSRPYRNFAEFLRHSLLQPLIRAPFEEVDRWIFAFMDRIAADLSSLALDCPEKDAPLVSVIMPAFDREMVIGEAIESVLMQSYGRFELIVVDDGSRDGTARVASSYSADPRVRLERNPQQLGVSATRNRALSLASGDLLAYLDSDNTWQPDYLASMVGAFLRMPDLDAAYSGQYLFSPGQPEPTAVRFAACNKSLLRNNNYIDLNCFMHRRSVLARAGGGFCETLRRLEDWDLVLRIAQTGRMVSVPVLQSNYFHNRTGNSISSNEPLEPSLAELARRMIVLAPSEPSPRLDQPPKVVTVNPLDPSSRAAALAQPDADILLLHPEALLQPGAIEALQAAAYTAPEVAMTVPQQVLPAGHSDTWMHVPYVLDSLPCDVSLSICHGNVEKVGLFHDGEGVELNFATLFCAYIKREAWNRCGGVDVRHERADRIICEYLRHVLGMKIIYAPAAVVSPLAGK